MKPETNTLATARLSLRELTPAQVAQLLDPEVRSDAWITGYPLPGSRNAAAGFGRRGPDDLRYGFGMYHIVHTEDGLVIGDMGFHRPPVNGVVEVGFGLAEAGQGAGYADEALAELVRWAFTQAEVEQVVARTLDHNTPARSLLSRTGFRPVGRDGEFEQFIAVRGTSTM